MYGEDPRWAAILADREQGHVIEIGTEIDTIDLESEGKRLGLVTDTDIVITDKSYYVSQAIWRTSLFGHKKKNYDQLEKNYDE